MSDEEGEAGGRQRLMARDNGGEERAEGKCDVGSGVYDGDVDCVGRERDGEIGFLGCGHVEKTERVKHNYELWRIQG